VSDREPEDETPMRLEEPDACEADGADDEYTPKRRYNYVREHKLAAIDTFKLHGERVAILLSACPAERQLESSRSRGKCYATV
jgi:hypothetical protein